ncbi:MAG: NAD(P)-dependent glycerol-3-phosphate dehydrogenase, partial [Planctomycetes bacterium]|nr:NAD(P)-dependent glycerol-3-phosphate dehydrogenase [Planctomycetota bacterium]
TAKGIENDTLLRPTEVLAELCGWRSYAMLSGPSIAREIAAGLPCSVVIACEDETTAKMAQAAFNTETFRVYTNTDLVGVELASAMKNIIAIAAGIIDGLKLGDNAKAALLSRGLVEITRLGVAMGAKVETFYGLAGVGDLVTTCISPYGRNRTAGQDIGQGRSPAEVIQSTPSIIEGIPTTKSVVALARKHHVDLPIVEAVGKVLFEGLSPSDAVHSLMTREPRAE